MDGNSGRMRRRALLALLAAGGGLAGALRLALAQSAASENMREGVRQVRGEVTVNGKPVRVGDPVRPGDTVATGRRSLAAFVVGRDAFLVRDSTRVEIVGGETAADLLRLVTGKLLGVFGAGRGRRLITTNATIGIRGTGAYLEAEAARTYFCLCYGTADVATADGRARDSYTTTHHESPRYLYGDGRKDAIVTARVSNHTDAELIMLEALVGRTPPREVMDGYWSRY
jgi:hypothetical protein